MLDYIFEEIDAKIGECRMAIPKIVHYCWFGGKEKPDDAKNVLKVGNNTFQIIGLWNGMKKTLT